MVNLSPSEILRMPISYRVYDWMQHICSAIMLFFYWKLEDFWKSSLALLMFSSPKLQALGEHKQPIPPPPLPHTHTRTYIHPLLSDVHSWQSSWTSVFRGQNVPDWTSSAQSRVSNIQYITNLSRSLSLCAVSALALPPSVFPSHCLLLSVSLTTNAAKLRVSCALYISASISLTRFVHAPNLYSLIFLPCTIISFSLPCVSCPHVLFLTLPELASLSRSLALLHHSLSLSFCSVYSPAELQG